MDLHRYEGHLNPKPPYEFEHSKRFIRQAYLGDAVTDIEHTLTFPLLFQDQCLIVSLRSRGKVESPLLMLTVHSPIELTDSQFADVQIRIQSFLGLEEEIQPLYSRGWDDDPFADILDKWYGYHQVRFSSPFASACYALLAQNGEVAAARAAWSRLLNRYGLAQEIDGQTLRTFPTASAVASLTLADVEIDLLGQTDRLQAVARSFSSRPEFSDAHTANKWLREETDLNEFGRQLVLTRGFGFTDTIFQTKEELLPLAQTIYGHNFTLDGVTERLAYYEGWQGYWLLHLQLAELE